MAASLFEEVSSAFSDIAYSNVNVGGVAASLSRLPTFSLKHPCTNGGQIVGSMTFTDKTNDDLTGSISGSMSITPQQCVVSAGSKRLAVNGDPSLNFSFSVSLIRGELSSNFVWHATGGIKWRGGSCAVNYTVTLTPRGSGSISGKACGQGINATF